MTARAPRTVGALQRFLQQHAAVAILVYLAVGVLGAGVAMALKGGSFGEGVIAVVVLLAGLLAVVLLWSACEGLWARLKGRSDLAPDPSENGSDASSA